jgi:hypothetical protein
MPWPGMGWLISRPLWIHALERNNRSVFPDPGFDSMRSYPRYHALLRRMNLEP